MLTSTINQSTTMNKFKSITKSIVETVNSISAVDLLNTFFATPETIEFSFYLGKNEDRSVVGDGWPFFGSRENIGDRKIRGVLINVHYSSKECNEFGPIYVDVPGLNKVNFKRVGPKSVDKIASKLCVDALFCLKRNCLPGTLDNYCDWKTGFNVKSYNSGQMVVKASILHKKQTGKFNLVNYEDQIDSIDSIPMIKDSVKALLLAIKEKGFEDLILH